MVLMSNKPEPVEVILCKACGASLYWAWSEDDKFVACNLSDEGEATGIAHVSTCTRKPSCLKNNEC